MSAGAKAGPVPRSLLDAYDLADSHEEFDGEGIQLWFDFRMEAMLHGVDPDLSREELVEKVEGPTEEPAPTGRAGGLATLERYGRGHFALLALRRWNRISPEELTRALRAEGPRPGDEEATYDDEKEAA